MGTKTRLKEIDNKLEQMLSLLQNQPETNEISSRSETSTTLPLTMIGSTRETCADAFCDYREGHTGGHSDW